MPIIYTFAIKHRLLYIEDLIGLKPKLLMPYYSGEAQIAVCIFQANLKCIYMVDNQSVLKPYILALQVIKTGKPILEELKPKLKASVL